MTQETCKMTNGDSSQKHHLEDSYINYNSKQEEVAFDMDVHITEDDLQNQVILIPVDQTTNDASDDNELYVNRDKRNKRKETSSPKNSLCKFSCLSSSLTLIVLIFISCIILMSSSSSSIFVNAGRYAREASPSIASPAAPVVSSATSPPHLHNGGNEINNETGERRSSTRSVSSSSPSETTKAFGSTTVFDDHSGRTMVETPETYNPIFISSATTITVRQNDSVSIPCEVKNLGGGLVMVWRVGLQKILFTQNLKVHPDKRFAVDSGTTNDITRLNLKIDNVNADDEGEYICMVSTMTPMQIVHTLKVLVPPTIDVSPNQTRISAKKGDNVDLECKPKGNPQPMVSWRRNNREDGRDIWMDELKNHQVLNLQNVSRFSSGSYECKATNEVGEATVTFKVDVNYKPEVEVDNKIIHTGKGIDTTLTCRVYAMPEATVFWTRERDSKEIHESMTKFWMSHDRGTSEHTLKITNVDPDNDFDNYTCIAENKEGITHGVIELVGFAQTVNIKSKPAAYSPFASYNAEWEVVSHSPITQYKLRYRKTRDLSSMNEPFEDVGVWIEVDNINASSSTQYGSFVYQAQYKLSQLEWATTYELQVEAKNEFGWNRPNEPFRFKVLSAPLMSDDASHLTPGHASLLALLSFFLLRVILHIDHQE